jgi:hypothetical protein
MVVPEVAIIGLIAIAILVVERRVVEIGVRRHSKGEDAPASQ